MREQSLLFTMNKRFFLAWRVATGLESARQQAGQGAADSRRASLGGSTAAYIARRTPVGLQSLLLGRGCWLKLLGGLRQFRLTGFYAACLGLPARATSLRARGIETLVLRLNDR